MLAHLRQRIAATLAPPRVATFSTSGEAGLQACVVPCAGRGLVLYLLLPRTSDHLLNLEGGAAALVTTPAWQVTGRARILPAMRPDLPRSLRDSPYAPWSVVVEVRPTRVAIARAEGWGAAETIDLE
jgi:hypothetical protein